MRRWLIVLAAVPLIAGTLVTRRTLAAERREHAAHQRAADLVILDQRIAFYSARVLREPKGALDLGRLSALYLQRGRQTGSYEDLSRAEAMARQSYGNRRARNSGAAMVLAQSLLAQHQYLEAYQVTSDVAALDSSEIEPRALKAELELELGRYADADESFRALEAQKWQLSVATRYARWLEVEGHDAQAYRMLAAAESLSARQWHMPAEQQAWFHLRVADFALRHGRLSEASAALQRGYDVAPDDYRLEALDARLAAAQGNWNQVLAAGNRSIAQVLDPATLGLMADAASYLGDTATSSQYARTMLVAVAAQPGPYHRAAALYLLDHRGDVAQVLQRTRSDIAVRQDVYGLDLMAWTLYRHGDFPEANGMISRALAVGTHDAQIEYHASLIAQASGDQSAARQLLERVRTDNPFLLPFVAPVAR